jgi:hypothetical protein
VIPWDKYTPVVTPIAQKSGRFTGSLPPRTAWMLLFVHRHHYAAGALIGLATISKYPCAIAGVVLVACAWRRRGLFVFAPIQLLAIVALPRSRVRGTTRRCRLRRGHSEWRRATEPLSMTGATIASHSPGIGQAGRPPA